MKMLVTRCAAVAGLVLSLGCYHATIETGAPPSNEVISKSFASGWIFGLVPPSTVSTAAKCPSGVSKVETQLSFVNQLVGWLTLYIYTPMSIKVTCAAKTGTNDDAEDLDVTVSATAGPEGIGRAFQEAGRLVVTSGHAIYVTIASTPSLVNPPRKKPAPVPASIRAGVAGWW